MNATIAGIDIGGTKIRSAVMRGRRVLAAREIKTPAHKNLIEQALRDEMRELVSRGASRIGVSIAGTVARNRTVVLHCHNIPALHNVRMSQFAPRGVTVRVENDARCFARAEATLGASRGAASSCAFILGTGVGRAFAKGRVPQVVKRFESAERWEAEYQRRKAGPPQKLAQFLAPYLSRIIAALRPGVIVIGGGAMRKPRFFALLKAELHRAGVTLPIRRSLLRQNGPAVGAALLAK